MFLRKDGSEEIITIRYLRNVRHLISDLEGNTVKS